MQSNTRVVGSNFSVFRWRGRPIAYLERVADSGRELVGSVEAVHPLGSDHPTEFALPAVMGHGTLNLTIRELWDRPVWQHFQGLSNQHDLLGVWRSLAADPSVVTCETIIKPPGGNRWRIKTYHNVVITDLDDSETVWIGAMSVARIVSCAYTHATHAFVAASG